MSIFPTPTLSSRPVLPTAGVHLASANARVFLLTTSRSSSQEARRHSGQTRSRSRSAKSDLRASAVVGGGALSANRSDGKSREVGTFSDPRKAQFGYERGGQKANRQRSVRPVRGVQVHQHGKSIPTHRFSLSAKTVGGIHG